MFKNSDNDNDTEVGHTHSGILFRKVPLMDLFKQSYGPLNKDKDFYNEEEVGRSDEEYLEFARTEEVEIEEFRREQLETSGTAPNVEVSNITPPIILATLINQSNQISKSNHSTITSSLAHT
jgi:hypothetical protein